MSRIEELFALHRALDFMEQNLEEPLTLAQVAAAAGYAPRYFSRIFHEIMDQPPMQYLRDLRLRRAIRLLSEHSRVLDVALKCAFDSHEGFTRAFVRRYGVPPTQFFSPSGEGNCGETWRFGSVSAQDWGSGQNPIDGRWRLEWYEPGTGFGDMLWNGEWFEAPFDRASSSDPRWYCRVRWLGWNIHPSAGCDAAISFFCPHAGRVRFSLCCARMVPVTPLYNGSAVRLMHNDRLLTGDACIEDAGLRHFSPCAEVQAGDKLRFLVNSLGNSFQDGMYIFHLEVSYLS